MKKVDEAGFRHVTLVGERRPLTVFELAFLRALDRGRVRALVSTPRTRRGPPSKLTLSLGDGLGVFTLQDWSAAGSGGRILDGRGKLVVHAEKAGELVNLFYKHLMGLLASGVGGLQEVVDTLDLRREVALRYRHRG